MNWKLSGKSTPASTGPARPGIELKVSAFFGMIRLDSESPDRGLLQDMASYLAVLGPDQQSIWVEGRAGMVHALLKTTENHVVSRQPLTYGRYTIVGDVRLDGRAVLVRQMRELGQTQLEHCQDVELLLRAWMLWGTDATDFLAGDFSVAIWDSTIGRLVCLRDQMGVKPFFYVRKGGLLLFSNTLNCLRRHPDVAGVLNDQAVVDFLAFGFNLDVSSSIYRDIQRLAPAHRLELSPQRMRLERYWSPAIEPLLRYRRTEDYVEHFREILSTALSDRLATTNVTVAMSGGLDSTALAAFAHDISGDSKRLHLHTLDISSLWSEDREAKHAKLVADSLGVAHQVHRLQPEALFEQDNSDGWALPEPSRDSFWSANLAVFRQMAGASRVGLSGHGADSLLAPPRDHFGALAAAHKWGQLLGQTIEFYRIHRRRPPMGLRTALKSRYERSPLATGLPVWLRPEMVVQTGLEERYRLWLKQEAPARLPDHPRRPEAFRELMSPIWPATVLRFDPQTTGLPLEFRHPYLDLRLLRFVFSMPAVPWFHNKLLLREASRGLLPGKVRLRVKDMPRVSPIHRGMNTLSGRDLGACVREEESIAAYLDVQLFDRLARNPAKLKPDEADQVALPMAFSRWLQGMRLQ